MRNFLDKNLPFIFWTIVILAGTWASWVVVTGIERVPVIPATQENKPVDQIPPAIVDRPIIEEVSADGSVRWTLYLDRIVREEDSVMELDKPRAIYRLQAGEVLEVTSATGIYDEEAGILTLSGGVTGFAREAQFDFSVDHMVWDSGNGLLTATGGVRLNRSGLVLTGTDLSLDLAEELTRIEVSGGVEVRSMPGALENLTRTN